ncbi:MAG: hypothetical protein A2172_05085 [Candidatus Woykebacteria bacterium RBG_13_40_15]|uniref:SCP domain-containing protein n=1 Tax=Candidatus Woykebacteria bacterium RBG_13_40_15 TaxID=1802593 RepID=A0A1G1W8J4_9BACT|nr:MAG: hypothetical protein A2172_05085 [Candidatus Woykebacteria bacterium RBG_13_40_15]
MSVNFIDIVVLFFALYFVWQGYHTGFIGGILNIVSTIASFTAAIIFYPPLASFLGKTFNWSDNLSLVISFFSILIFFEVILGFLLNRLYAFVAPVYKKIQNFILADKILGVFPSLLTGLFLVSLFLLLPLILPVKETVKEPISKSWWGKNVLVGLLQYQPQIETVLNRLPYKNLAYLITPQPLSKESIKLDFPKEIKLTPDPANEKVMFDLVNKERANSGIKTLVWSDALMDVARAHCLDMFSRGYFSHYTPEGLSPFDRMDKAGITYTAAGENLAYAPNVEIAHQGLMNSPGHKANILRVEFGHLGVGVIDGGINGKMFCQEFTN